MEDAPMAPPPEEVAPPVTKMMEEPVQDNPGFPEPEQISNGNGDHEAAMPMEDEPMSAPPVEDAAPIEDAPPAEDAPEPVAEAEAEPEAPKDAFDQMLTEEKKEEPDNFDKMLEGDEEQKEETDEPSEAGKEETEAKNEDGEEAKEDKAEGEAADENKETDEAEAKPDDSETKTEDSETKTEDAEMKTEDSETKADDAEKKDDDTEKSETGEKDTEKSETEAKEESAEADKDANTFAGKDSFDKMLSGESTEEPKDESDEKKSENAPATTIDADALDETVTDEPEMVAEITSEKVPNDEKYFGEVIKTEEKEWLENPENEVSFESVCVKLCCSICPKNLDPVFGNKNSVNRHPHLGVPVCYGCRKFYGDGDWVSSEDGDEYCRFCGQGGDILLCDKCPNAFCKKCLQKNLGARALREITKSEEWRCLVCDPSPIYKLKAIYYCVYKNQEQIKTKREEDIKKAKEKKAAQRARASAPTNKEKQDLLKSPKNFLEENISEAFKTLDVYQKSLETERSRCIKAMKEGMTVEMATSITRKLRKLYAVTQKNMDLLDRAIVESFVENYPMESTRIHMGRVAPNDPPTPRKPKPKAGKQKIKIKAKNKKGKAKPKGKKGTIRMNGAPVYRDASEVYRPSLTKKKKRKADSDVECIDVSEDDDYYRPKKKARPGPASSKKAKPGPASRKAGPKSKTSYY